MQFSNDIIQNKMKYINVVDKNTSILNKILKKYINGNFKIQQIEREWFPGGGSNLFKIVTKNKNYFLKVMCLKIFIESKLEKEKKFLKIPSIKNEYFFIKEIKKFNIDNIPRIVFYDELENYGFLATEWLEPFEKTIKYMNIDEIIEAYIKIYNFVKSLFENNIIHTDIHEKNIRFRGKIPVMIDYGEARYFRQDTSFEKSLDYAGINKYGNVGKMPISNNNQVNGHTCLKRLKLVFDSYMEKKLLEYSQKCNFGDNCPFNKDILQQPDDRVYQSIKYKGLNIEGQRPGDDRREKFVKFVCKYYSEKFNKLTYIDIGSNIGAFCFKVAELPRVERIFGVEAFKNYIRFAEGVRFILNSGKIMFCNLVCGKDDIYKKICEFDNNIISKKILVTILSTYHHIENKEFFLSNLKKIKPEILLMEFATQDRYYSERGNWENEVFFIKEALKFKFINFLGISEDYKRPLVIYSREKMGILLRVKLKFKVDLGKKYFKKNIKKVFTILHVRLKNIQRFLQKDLKKIKKIEYKNSCEMAIRWLKNNQIKNGGIIISSKQRTPYPEVTGYIIPTLYRWGEKELVRDLIIWLMHQQNEDGSFSAPDGTPYTFDTGQVIRGFVVALDDLPEVEKPLRKACDWILTQVQPDGRLATPSIKMWGKIADDRIHLYVLSPLIDAGKKLNASKYIDAAQHVLDYYKQKKDLTDFNTLSHFYAYVIEALCDLGEIDLAKKAMENIAVLQNKDGSIPAYKNVHWVCSTGVAQFAVMWYKLGMREYADKALYYLEKIQNRSGGFYGSYRRKANYFPEEEISWAVKFFLDAYYWKIKITFNQEVSIFSESIDENDGRVQEMLNFFGNLNGKKIIDIGCGKGRFLRILKSKFSKSDLYGLDISEKMLSFCPKEIKTVCGSILDIRYPDKYFDYVYCIETLEHSLRIENSVKELVRILKPGGKIIIIDKNIAKLGILKLESWEQWFNPKEIINLLQKYGVKSHYKLISYGKHQQPDGLFIAWEGVRNE